MYRNQTRTGHHHHSRAHSIIQSSLLLELWNASRLIVPKRNVQILQTLGSSALQQVINHAYHNHPLSIAVHLESTDLEAVLKFDILDFRYLVLNLDELFILEEFGVEFFNLFAGHFLLEGSRKGRDDTLEPRGNVRDECYFDFAGLTVGGEKLGQLVSGFAFVDVVGEGVGADAASEVLRGDLGDRLALASGGFRGLGTSSGVSRHAEHGRSSSEVKHGEERSNQGLVVGGVAAGVGDQLGSLDLLAAVDFCMYEEEKVTISAHQLISPLAVFGGVKQTLSASVSHAYDLNEKKIYGSDTDPEKRHGGIV